MGEKGKRSQWDNELQFILTAIGLAVGISNIWRFPSMAYQNGGSAFLIPYMISGLIFGLPMVYAEMTIGQYSRAGPGLAFGRYTPGLQGVGWTMALISITVAIYYCVVIAWSGVYLGWIVSGNSRRWTTCGNNWNTDYCVALDFVTDCRKNTSIGAPQYYFNGSCVPAPHILAKQPAEEFFINWLTPRSDGIYELGSVQWWVFGSLVVMWVVTTITLIKGIGLIGKLSYVTVTLPYLVIVILFFRGITLEGASKGIEYFLLKPDFSKLFDLKTWGIALKQMMFSMSIGLGGLISLSSHNKFNNNHFRDCLIVIVCDSLMSIIGGVAVFSTLGYLANKLGKDIDEVVEAGTSLAFIAYPEAMASMPAHYIWEFLFFTMLFLLGITSELTFIEAFTSCICDVFPKAERFKWLVTVITCSVCFALGVVMCTGAGWYWFMLYESFTSSTLPGIVAAMEVLILATYGWQHVKQDLADMLGEARRDGIRRFFSPHSPIFGIFWAFICPILAVIAAYLTLQRDSFPMKLSFGVDASGADVKYQYPLSAEIIGWILNLGPLVAIPCFFFYKLGLNIRFGKPFSYLFRPDKDLKSCERYFKQKELPSPDEFERNACKYEENVESSISTICDYLK